jgi:serine/threonine-protein kinase
VPDDLLDEGRRRLAAVALMYALGYTIAYGAAKIAGSPGWQGENPSRIGDWIAISCIAAAILIFFAARSKRCEARPERIYSFGLVFLVVGAFGIDMWWIWNTFPADFRPNGISWSCVWIVFFPMVMPNRPSKLVLPTLLAASMFPLSVMLSIARGSAMLPLSVLVYWFLPTYICAVMSFKAGCIVHGWGRHLRRAREMGSYRLIELLGSGGMGEVWLAKHRMLARPAAIKLIRSERLGIGSADSTQTSETVLRRFEREAQATASLNSPHTVELYDFGRTADGTFYYVMELLDGVNLETLVSQFGPQPPERVAHLLEQACDSLADAHHSGLIHRDIKPANIYACRKGLRHDVAKVLDFGLVKATTDKKATDGRLTVEGITTGTPAYIAPESGLGNTDIDGRADLYSLGCVGYWLLTGELVFDSESPMKMVVDHVHTAPAPISERTEIDIPEKLERAIMRCLEKNADDRPQTASELAEELVACQFERPWTAERATRWWQTHLPQRLCGDSKAAAS